MISRFLTSAIIILSLAACSSAPKKPEGVTLADLLSKPRGSLTTEYDIPTVDSVIKTYQALLVSPTDDTDSPAIKQRIGDLLVVEAAELLGQDEDFSEDADNKLADAITLYQSILATEPSTEGNDRVWYQLAKAFDLSIQPEYSQAALTELVTRYPNSPFLAEAEFRRGERFFVLGEFRQAEQAYSNALKASPEAKFAENAQYKLGWSLFKQSVYDESLVAFFTILDDKQTEYTELSLIPKNKRALFDDTLHVISLTFSYQQGAKTIKAFFDSYGSRNYEPIIYDALAKFYLTKERALDAAKTYKAYVAHHPDNKVAPNFQQKTIDTYKAAGYGQFVLDEKINFVKQYGPRSKFWSQNTNETLSTLLKPHVFDLTQYHHANAQKQPSTVNVKKAVEMYDTYLLGYPKAIDVGKMQFLKAELLFDSKQYARAADAFKQSAYSFTVHENSANAGYNYILSLNELAKNDKMLEARAIDAHIKFAETFDKDNRALPVLITAANAYYQRKDYIAAAGYAQKIVEWQPMPTQKQKLEAWQLKADSHYALGEYSAAEKAYSAARKLVNVNNKKYNELSDSLAEVIYLQASAYKSGNQTELAISTLLRIAAVAPKSATVATAQFDAATLMLANKQWQSAIDLLNKFRKSYPNHKLQETVPEKLAYAYESSGNKARASGEYAIIAKTHKDPEIRREALWQAATLATEANNQTLAIQHFKTYAKTYRLPFDPWIQSQQKLVELYKARKEKAKQFYWLEQLIQADAKAGAYRSDQTKAIAAAATFTLAEPHYEAFKRVKIKAPLKKTLLEKKNAMTKAMKRYQAAAKYGVQEYATGAIHRMGEMYQEFSADLIDSPRPKNLDEDALEQYEILLEEQAFPFEEQALEIYAINAKRPSEGIFDEWVKKTFSALATLQPGRFAKQEALEEFDDEIQ